MRTLLKTALVFVFLFSGINFCRAEGVWSSGPWNPREPSGSEAKAAADFKNNLTALKNKRDSEVNALIRERDAKIQEMVDGLNRMNQAGVAQFNSDKARIQKEMLAGKNMAKEQAMLARQQQSLAQKSTLIQQQINNVKTVYDQQIQALVAAYAQQFEILRQRMATER